MRNVLALLLILSGIAVLFIWGLNDEFAAKACSEIVDTNINFVTGSPDCDIAVGQRAAALIGGPVLIFWGGSIFWSYRSR